MAKVDAKNAAPLEAAPTEAWGAFKLLFIGIATLGVALTIIIMMGSRLGGCMYLDGSH